MSIRAEICEMMLRVTRKSMAVPVSYFNRTFKVDANSLLEWEEEYWLQELRTAKCTPDPMDEIVQTLIRKVETLTVELANLERKVGTKLP